MTLLEAAAALRIGVFSSRSLGERTGANADPSPPLAGLPSIPRTLSFKLLAAGSTVDEAILAARILPSRFGGADGLQAAKEAGAQLERISNHGTKVGWSFLLMLV